MDTYGNHSISVSLANDFPDWYERFPFREAARKCRWQDNFLLHTYEYFGNSQALHRPWTQDDGARPNDFVLLQCAAKSSSLAWIIGYDTFLLLSPTSIWCVSNGSHAVRMTLLLLVFYLMATPVITHIPMTHARCKFFFGQGTLVSCCTIEPLSICGQVCREESNWMWYGTVGCVDFQIGASWWFRIF